VRVVPFRSRASRGVVAIASKDEAQQAIYDAIKEASIGQSDASSLRDLAEAWAWVTNPSQPHGGSINVSQ
jgi:hypothetical protein